MRVNNYLHSNNSSLTKLDTREEEKSYLKKICSIITSLINKILEFLRIRQPKPISKSEYMANLIKNNKIKVLVGATALATASFLGYRYFTSPQNTGFKFEDNRLPKGPLSIPFSEIPKKCFPGDELVSKSLLNQSSFFTTVPLNLNKNSAFNFSVLFGILLGLYKTKNKVKFLTGITLTAASFFGYRYFESPQITSPQNIGFRFEDSRLPKGPLSIPFLENYPRSVF